MIQLSSTSARPAAPNGGKVQRAQKALLALTSLFPETGITGSGAEDF